MISYAVSAPRTLCKPTAEHFCAAPNVMIQQQIVHMTLAVSQLAMMEICDPILSYAECIITTYFNPQP